LLNLRYWVADQSLDWGVGEVVVDCEVAMVRVKVAIGGAELLSAARVLGEAVCLDPKLRVVLIYAHV
jgi:hypothetical protein